MSRVAATKALSNTSLFLSRVVYQTTYTISYGVVFPAAFVARAILGITRLFVVSSREHRRRAQRADAILGRSL